MKYHFRYKSQNKDLQLLIEAENMNTAMIYFAENYHDIQHIYGIFELPIK